MHPLHVFNCLIALNNQRIQLERGKSNVNYNITIAFYIAFEIYHKSKKL